jgi:hypothetical protein
LLLGSRFVDIRNYADALQENLAQILTVHAVSCVATAACFWHVSLTRLFFMQKIATAVNAQHQSYNEFGLVFK